MGTPAQGYASQLGIHTADPVTAKFRFLSCNLKKRDERYQSPGITGTRSRETNTNAIVRRMISGSLSFEPNVTDFDLLMPWAIGGSTSTGVTSLLDALPSRYIVVDYVTKVITYAGCVSGRMTLSGDVGRPLQLSVDVTGKTASTGNSGTFPSLSHSTGAPFILSNCVLTIGGTARNFKSFQFVVDNLIDTGRFLNSLTLTDVVAQDRDVSLTVSLPYDTDNDDLYEAAAAGLEGSLAFGDGSSTYTATFGKLIIPDETPDVPGKSEIMLPLNMKCLKDGSDLEVQIVKA